MDSQLAVRRQCAQTREEPGEPDRFRLTLLGGFGLAERDRGIVPPLGAQRLLAFLALQRQPQPRTRVAGTLWPDGTEAQSSANLRSTLWRLRRPGFSLVQATSNHLSLAHGLAVDVHEVTGMVRRLQNPAALCRAEDLDPERLADELLPTWSTDDWIVVERERLRQLCLHGLEAMCERLLTLRRYGEAVQASLAAVRAEPLRESAHRALIAVYLAEGNHCEALRQYRWYEQLLEHELGIRPSTQMARLVGHLQHAI